MFSYDADVFIDDLKETVDYRRRKNKEPEQIRYIVYVTWAVALRENEVGPLDDGEQPKYTFPRAAISFLRTLVPENIKGEIWPNAHKVTMEEFCESLKIPKK